jgi:hypothetical protein
VADGGNAEVDQILGREFTQHLGVDVIVLKGFAVALEPQVPQPSYNVHRRLPVADRVAALRVPVSAGHWYV